MTDRGKPFPLRIAGAGERFIACPDCGERLDKEDIGSVLEHEETCPGAADLWPADANPSSPPKG
jgi:hypothetical protein